MSAMGNDHEIYNTKLGLGIGLDDFVPNKKDQQKKKTVICFDLSFPPYFKDEDMVIGHKIEGSGSKTVGEKEERQISKISTATNTNDDGNNNSIVRKKLRLTKEQSTVLEDSFKQHTTPNTDQKQAIAEKLNLKPSQVEVWFQNKRARTKLKKTGVDCEFLKKCCEKLSNENERLKKELLELQLQLLFHAQLPSKATTTIAMCASCEKMWKSSAKGSSGNAN